MSSSDMRALAAGRRGIGGAQMGYCAGLVRSVSSTAPRPCRICRTSFSVACCPSSANAANNLDDLTIGRVALVTPVSRPAAR